MAIEVMKVGIVSCSGEELPEGTISRVACRRVLDDMNDATVTICLPLFLAGGSEERDFASKYPTITVDGCDKCCALKSTERLSGKPSRALLIPEILQKHGLARPTQLRKSGAAEEAAVQAVIEEVTKAVQEVLDE